MLNIKKQSTINDVILSCELYAKQRWIVSEKEKNTNILLRTKFNVHITKERMSFEAMKNSKKGNKIIETYDKNIKTIKEQKKFFIEKYIAYTEILEKLFNECIDVETRISFDQLENLHFELKTKVRRKRTVEK